MKHEASRTLFAYWNGLRGERSAPERSEIEPAALRTVLADTFMLEVDAQGRFPFRLAGTRVNGLFAGEQKGASFLDLWRPEERRNIAAVLFTVTDGACPVVVGSTGAPRDHAGCGIELLFLPLRHFGKTHARILGIATPAGQPAWLGLLPLEPLTMRSLRMVDDAGAALATGRPSPIVPMSAPMVGNAHRAGSRPSFSASRIGAARGGLAALTPAATRGGRPFLQVIEGGRV